MLNNDLLNRNKNINRGYRKLIVWQEGVALYIFVQAKIRTIELLPFKIKAQIEDSILSVPSNIAEGFSRRSLKEYIHFVNISLSSLSENYTQLFSIHSTGDVNKTFWDEYDQKHYSLENKLVQMNKTMIQKLGQNVRRNDYIIKEMIEHYKVE